METNTVESNKSIAEFMGQPFLADCEEWRLHWDWLKSKYLKS